MAVVGKFWKIYRLKLRHNLRTGVRCVLLCIFVVVIHKSFKRISLSENIYVKHEFIMSFFEDFIEKGS